MTGVQTCALPICFPVTIGRTMSETECAELWYAKALAHGEKTSYSDKYKIKLRVFAVLKRFFIQRLARVMVVLKIQSA